MKICKICLDKNTLCQTCGQKLERGEISQIDVDVSKAVKKLIDTSDMGNVDFQETIDTGNHVVIISNDVNRLVGLEGTNIKKLSNILGKPIRILSQPRSSKDLIERLLGDVELLGVNMLYTNSGGAFRIRIRGDFRNKLPMQPKEFSVIVKKLTGKDVELVFE